MDKVGKDTIQTANKFGKDTLKTIDTVGKEVLSGMERFTLGSNKGMGKLWLYGIFALLLYFMSVNGNYIGNTLGCKYIDFFEKNIYIKHAIGLVVMFLFVMLSMDIKEYHPIILITFTLCGYLVFVLSARTQFPFGLIVFAILLLVYILDIFKNYHISKKNEEKDNDILEQVQALSDKIDNKDIKNAFNGLLNYHKKNYDDVIIKDTKTKILTSAQLVLGVIAVVMLFVVSGIYLKRKHKEYGSTKEFSWVKLFLGNVECKGDKLEI